MLAAKESQIEQQVALECRNEPHSMTRELQHQSFRNPESQSGNHTNVLRPLLSPAEQILTQDDAANHDIVYRRKQAQ